MGLLKLIKAIWDPQAQIETTIDAQIISFEREKMLHPERDPNAWLAGALRSRIGWRGRPEVTYYSAVALYSLAPGKDAPMALAMWILSKEAPPLAAMCGPAFEFIMAPIMALVETGEIGARWRQVNPWTAKQYPFLAVGIERAGTPEGRAEAERELGRWEDR